MSSLFRHSQVWLSLLAAHLVVTAPSLCLAGLLKHPCECESTTEDCCADDRDSGCSPDGCSHDNCENDPCRTRVTGTPDRLGRVDLDPGLARLAAPLFLVPAAFLQAVFEDGPIARFGHSPLGPPGVRKRIPYHDADIPLLR